MPLKKSLPLLVLVLLLFPVIGFAQLDLKDFQLSGTAREISEQCIRLVPDEQYVSGSAWYKKPIDLTQPFEIEVCLVLGCKDEDGADGIVFVFYPSLARTGGRGENMGFGGLRPSLGIEFDTYLNYHLGDPEEDHLAIMPNGQTHHSLTLLGPVKLPNLEDCERHLLRLIWTPEENQLKIYLDKTLRATYNSDLVKDIFYGNPVVYWGVTAGTGRLSNDHDICIKKLIFTDASKRKNTDVVTTQPPLEGDTIALKDIAFASGTAQLAPTAYAQLQQLHRFLEQHPEHALAIAHTSDSPDKLAGERAAAIADYFIRRGVSKQRIAITACSAMCVSTSAVENASGLEVYAFVMGR